MSGAQEKEPRGIEAQLDQSRRRKLAEFQRAIILADPEDRLGPGQTRAEHGREPSRRRLVAGNCEDLVQGTAREAALQRAVGRAMAERRAFTAVLRLEPRLGEGGAQALKVLARAHGRHAARRDAVLSTRRRQSSDRGQ